MVQLELRVGRSRASRFLDWITDELIRLALALRLQGALRIVMRAASWVWARIANPVPTLVIAGVALVLIDPRFVSRDVTLGVIGLGILTALVIKARTHMVIEQIVDHTPAPSRVQDSGDQPGGQEEGPRIAAGLSTELAARLRGLADLYSESPSSESNLVSTPQQQIPIALQSEDVGTLVEGSVSAESSVRVGPLAFPARALAVAFVRLVRGPRLVGTLHGPPSQRILVVQLVGRGPSRVWRVAQDAAAGEDTDGVPADPEEQGFRLVEEIAYRIFCDLALPGSRSWRAVRAFVAGLSAYREAEESPKRRWLSLDEAEQAFFEAAGEDSTLGAAFHNLGVVYRSLGSGVSEEDRRAENAFLRATAVDPSLSDAHAALAQIRLGQDDVTSTVELCSGVASSQSPALLRTKALTTLGLAVSRAAPAEVVTLALRRPDNPSLAEHPSWRRLYRDRLGITSSARRMAWRALLGEELRRYRGHSPVRIRLSEYAAATCEHNRGVGQTSVARAGIRGLAMKRRAIRSFHRALRLEPSAAQTASELGGVLTSLASDALSQRGSRRLRMRAADAFGYAARLEPERAAHWARLAAALAGAGSGSADDGTHARGMRALWLSLRAPALTAQDDLTEIAAAASALHDEETANRVQRMPFFVQWVEALAVQGDWGVEELRASCAELRALDPGTFLSWERAQLELALGSHASVASDEAVSHLDEALTLLRGRHDLEVKGKGIAAVKAVRLADAGRLEDALASIEEAIRLDPLAHYERMQLAYIRQLRKEYELAHEALNRALALTHADSEPAIALAVQRGIGQIELLMAIEAPTGTEARRQLKQAATSLRAALRLSLVGPSTEHAEALYPLAIAHSMLGETALAVSQLSSVEASRPEWPMASYLLAANLFQAGAYEEGERRLRKLDERIQPELDQGASKAERVPDPIRIEVRGMLAARIGLAQSRSLAEREALPDKALQLAERARETVRETQQSLSEEDPELGDLLAADLTQLVVDSLTAKGRALLGLARTDEARQALLEAIGLSADGDAYLALGYVEERAAASASGTARQRLLVQAETHAARAESLDKFGLEEERISKLRSTLAGYAAQ